MTLSTKNASEKLEQKWYTMIVDGPGLRNAFYAGIFKAFQEKKIPLPKELFTWSGGVSVAIWYLLEMNMDQLLKWSIEECSPGILRPQKANTMARSYFDQIYSILEPRQVAKRLAPLRIWAAKKDTLGVHIFENLSGQRGELTHAMMRSAWIPFFTQTLSEEMVDLQFALSLHDTIPEQLYPHWKNGTHGITISVSRRAHSTIFLSDEDNDNTDWAPWNIFRKLFGTVRALAVDHKRSEKLFEAGYKEGMRYINSGGIFHN